METLARLAELLKARNAVDNEIATIIGRPAQIGHLGEFIAATIFDIKLNYSANAKSSDGVFSSGPLAGQTVNIKWYAQREGLLDINHETIPDNYLVLTGPKPISMSSRGGIRPLLIESVFLFNAGQLIARLRTAGIGIGIATSIRRQHWDEAELFPVQRTSRLILSEEQRQLLSLFR